MTRNRRTIVWTAAALLSLGIAGGAGGLHGTSLWADVRRSWLGAHRRSSSNDPSFAGIPAPDGAAGTLAPGVRPDYVIAAPGPRKAGRDEPSRRGSAAHPHGDKETEG